MYIKNELWLWQGKDVLCQKEAAVSGTLAMWAKLKVLLGKAPFCQIS